MNVVTSALHAYRVSNPFAAMTFGLIVWGLALNAVLLANAALLVFFVSALMFGVSEVNGRCGTSHVGTLIPLRAKGNGPWLKASLAYTMGGVVTSSLVGVFVGSLGRAIGVSLNSAAYALVPLSLVLVARELGWLRFSLPQVHRQTRKMWADEFGINIGAAMWGAHIGLAFFTVIKHGGFYILAAAALYLHPFAASALFVVYWLGRTVPIWAIPLVTDRQSQRSGERMARLVTEPERLLEYLVTVGLVSMALASTVLAD